MWIWKGSNTAKREKALKLVDSRGWGLGRGSCRLSISIFLFEVFPRYYRAIRILQLGPTATAHCRSSAITLFILRTKAGCKASRLLLQSQSTPRVGAWRMARDSQPWILASSDQLSPGSFPHNKPNSTRFAATFTLQDKEQLLLQVR